MDNPASWFILLCAAIFIAAWFARKCNQEIEENRRENDDFFWKRERDLRRK